MKVFHAFLGSVLAIMVAAPLFGQAPALSSIQAPYPNVQGQVRLAGTTYGAGVVAYGPVGTPLILSGSNLGSTGIVLFIPYVNGSPGSPVQATASTWTSSMVQVTVPDGASTGLVAINVGGTQSNGLPFIMTPETYASSCPAAPSNDLLQIFTSGLNSGQVGQPYSVTLEAGGGTPAYSWSITNGSLPSGLALNASTGVISGTPTQAVQSLSLTTKVTDASSPTQSATAVLNLNVEPSSTPTVIYDYCIGNSNSSCTSSGLGYDPAGNMLNYSDSVTGTWSMTDGDGDAGYDSLNRIIAASAASGPYAGLQATWNYDNFGNRTSENFSGELVDPHGPPIPGSSWASYNVKNQVQSSSSGSAPLYDAAGNVTQDDQNQYLYDADGRICAANDFLTGQMTGYLYDADGYRVAKGTITSLSCDTSQNGFNVTGSYILDPDGQQLTEMTWSGGQAQWAYTNVRAAGNLIANYSLGSQNQVAVNFQLRDWLGTLRVLTNSSGTVQEKCDSLPFGNGETCTNSGYVFTGKERDSESGNDYFGARYYASSMGRFLSPDTMPGTPDDPQSWNLYNYVLNNPLKNIDPDGHDVQVCDNNGQCKTISNDAYKAAQQAQNQGGLNAPTLDQVGNSKDANGNFTAVGITSTDANGNTTTVGSAKYVAGDNPGIDPYVGNNMAGLQTLGAADKVVTVAGVAVGAEVGVMVAATAGTAAVATVGRWGLQRLAIGASSPALLNLINRLYQAQDEIPGGTAGAVRNEVMTGEYINGGHSIKAAEMITALQNLIKSGQLSGSDQTIAGHIISDLKNSLGR